MTDDNTSFLIQKKNTKAKEERGEEASKIFLKTKLLMKVNK